MENVTLVTVGQDVRGLMAGTSVMTMRGEVWVENLVVGDKIITRDAGMVQLEAIKSQDVKITPILIMAGSLGNTRPDKDMAVAPDTRIHIRDWRAKAIFGADQATVPAHRLVDGEFIRTGDAQTMKCYELKLDMPHIIYADGLEVATL
ncbi:Hint domain-containing protein [Aestuariibius sp. HNIBRBA575]|uniref:Hint domain-containing protein n=1 Tax=Aestuariibius sp. HNIBRBA575 TaxID=3233343 RepID=UPI0034A5CFF7